MIRVVTVVGARPQFIKAAAVSRILRDLPGITESLIHTGQHYDAGMSDIFFEELSIPRPEFNLGIGSGSHGAQTGKMLEAIERVLIEKAPDWVLVYGDTNSTLAGALAASKLRIKTAHVEAGLRSFNRTMPEEINRILVDHCSDLLLAPTQTAVGNLQKERLPAESIKFVGDVMYDAALYYGEKAQKTSRILTTLSLQPKGYILATIHRAGNTDDRTKLIGILEGLRRASSLMPVVLPIHPRTMAAINESPGLVDALKGLQVISPVGYLDMIQLEKNARAIATDSGGVQKEAFFYRVPCVTLREETEWIETVERNANRLAGADPKRITSGIQESIKLGLTEEPGQVYGSGNAAAEIVSILQTHPPT